MAERKKLTIFLPPTLILISTPAMPERGTNIPGLTQTNTMPRNLEQCPFLSSNISAQAVKLHFSCQKKQVFPSHRTHVKQVNYLCEPHRIISITLSRTLRLTLDT